MTVEAPQFQVSSDYLATHISEKRASAIRQRMVQLIEAGVLLPGTRLPTIRQVAVSLDTSASAVSEAWAELRRNGLIETRRRGGTRIADVSETAEASPTGGWDTINLTEGKPDPQFHQFAAKAITQGIALGSPQDWRVAGITSSLYAAAQGSWPFPADDYLASPGGVAGLYAALLATRRPGAPVAVEDPTNPRTLSLLRSLDLTLIPIARDAHGLIAGSLRVALASDPVAIVYQPAHDDLSEHEARLRFLEITAEIEGSDSRAWIIEDDPLGALQSTELSLGEHFGERTLLIRGYGRAFGFDIHTSVIGGSGELVARIRQYFSNSGGWASRVLQEALAILLVDVRISETLQQARSAYARRALNFAEALDEEGVDGVRSNLLFTWVPVNDEGDALTFLAQAGIVVGGASACHLDRPARGMLRIATTRIPDSPERIVDLAGRIASATHRVQVYY